MTAAGYAYTAPHITSTALAHRPVTAGGSPIVVTASGLPPAPWPVLVTVGADGATCTQTGRNTTSITCTMPPGAGDVMLGISAGCEGTQSSDNAVTVTYAPPRVSAVTTPAGQPIDGGFPVHVRGQVRQGAILLCWDAVGNDGGSQLLLPWFSRVSVLRTSTPT